MNILFGIYLVIRITQLIDYNKGYEKCLLCIKVII